MDLPTKKSVAETGWPENATWLVYGPPKVGKTTFAAQWPETLILNTEPRGTRYVDGAYVVDIADRGDLIDAYKTLKAAYDSNKKPPYKTIAIDTIDAPADWICKKVMEELNTEAMGQASGGYDWITSRERVISIIRMFANLPVTLLILAHARPIEIEGGKQGATVDLFKSLARMVLAECENILYCTAEKGKRKIVFAPQSGIDMGSHHPALNAAGSCDLSYEALRSLIKDGGEHAVGK